MQPKTTDYKNTWILDRIINSLVDASIITSISIFIMLADNTGTYSEANPLNNSSLSPSFVLYLMIQTLYYFSFEAISGRTIGKIITNTVIVHKDINKKGRFISGLIRAFVRIIPLYGITILFTKNSEGLHDILSKTLVVKEEPREILVNILMVIVGLSIILLNLYLRARYIIIS